jgi:type II secretory pathway pseudopilin PulG
MSEVARPPQVPPIPQALQDPPGYRTAKVCGILSICCAVTCIGFPVAVILGIVALVKQAGAARAAREAPGTFRRPPSGALTMGIIGLVLSGLLVPTLGIGAAIAIPAFITQRDRARTLVLRRNLQAVKDQAEQLVLDNGIQSPGQLAKALQNDAALAELKNPYNPTAPALELAPAPSQPGTIALWPSSEHGPNGDSHARLLLTTSYRGDHVLKQLTDEVWVSPFGAPGTPEPNDSSSATPTP